MTRSSDDSPFAQSGAYFSQKWLILLVFLVAAVASGISKSVAQHQHSPSAESKASGQDTREFVKFPAPLIEHTLANMRDHLAALQEIQEHMAMGHLDVASRIAESRLGMSSLGLHEAHAVAQFMPKGMQDAGSAMHRAASRFAIAATDAGVTGDLKPALAALAQVTAQCVGCHAGYRIK